MATFHSQTITTNFIQSRTWITETFRSQAKSSGKPQLSKPSSSGSMLAFLEDQKAATETHHYPSTRHTKISWTDPVKPHPIPAIAKHTSKHIFKIPNPWDSRSLTPSLEKSNADAPWNSMWPTQYNTSITVENPEKDPGEPEVPEAQGQPQVTDFKADHTRPWLNTNWISESEHKPCLIHSQHCWMLSSSIWSFKVKRNYFKVKVYYQKVNGLL